MSNVTPVTALASPAYQKRVATQKKIARLQKVAASTKAIAANIATVEATANKTYSAFNHASKQLTAAQVQASIAPLTKMHSALGKNVRVAQRNLAQAIQANAPTTKCLAQLESLASLRSKVAALIIQAKASLAAEDEDLGDDLIPVDEEGYVVDTPAPAEEEVATPAAAAEDTPVEEVAPVTVPQEEEELTTATGELELEDEDASFSIPDLDLPTGEVDEQVAADLLNGEGATATAAATAAAAAASLRARTATRTPVSVPAGRAATASASDDAVLASLTADLAKM